jgi:LuxR family maltose regulon positive regulatory protein
MSIPPPLAAEVPREAVLRVLAASTRCPLTIVSAGPGWGKTTAVAGWARDARDDGGESVAWLTLRPTDDSTASFWDAVLTALRVSGSVPGGHPLARLSPEGGISAEFLVALNRGLDALREPTTLVLDDFHVIADDNVMTAVTDLVSRPTPMRLILLTRVDPPMPLHRLRLAGLLAEVNAADLAFDADAVRKLAAAAESLELADGDLGEVLARTEGWPAGVRLATMFLAREGVAAGLGGFGGSDKSVAEYLVAEVLNRNSPEVREFLLRTSVVELISGDLADAIVPGGRGHAQLTELVDSNQFIACVNPDRTVFRYHPLLRDLLVHSLQHEGPAEFRAANRAAASWFLAKSHPVRALGHAVAAEDWNLAADAFFDASPSLVGLQGRTVVEHLRTIPFASLTPTAALELCAAGLAYGSGHFEAMASHLAETRRLNAQGSPLPALGLAFMELLTCATARVRSDDAAIGASAAAALDHASRAAPGAAADSIRLIAMTQAGIAQVRAGDVLAARERLAAVVRDSSAGDVELMRLGVRSQLAWCELVDGRIDAAIQQARGIVDDARTRGLASQLQIRPAYLTVAVAQLLQGDFEAADRVLVEGVAADANGVEAWPTIALHLAQASVAVARVRPRAATSALALGRAAMRGQSVSPALADTLTRVTAEVAMLTGAVHEHAIVGEDSTASATDWSTQARIELHRGNIEAALRAAHHVPRHVESGSLDDVVASIEATICEALAAAHQRRPAKAATIMGEALGVAASRRIARPFLTIGTGPMRQIIGAVPAEGDALALRDAVLQQLGSAHEDALLPEPEPLAEPLTEREIAVLTMLPTMRTNEEIARDFYVSVNTVKSHLAHLYRKLGVTNRRDAVRRARELALLP